MKSNRFFCEGGRRKSGSGVGIGREWRTEFGDGLYSTALEVSSIIRIFFTLLQSRGPSHT